MLSVGGHTCTFAPTSNTFISLLTRGQNNRAMSITHMCRSGNVIPSPTAFLSCTEKTSDFSQAVKRAWLNTTQATKQCEGKGFIFLINCCKMRSFLKGKQFLKVTSDIMNRSHQNWFLSLHRSCCRLLPVHGNVEASGKGRQSQTDQSDGSPGRESQ